MKRELIAVAVVAVAAVVPRVWILSATSEVGLFADMFDYYDRARHLFDHGRLYPDAFRVPGYPIAIAAAFTAFGQGLPAVRILQCAILVSTAVATYVLARGALTTRRALVAGLIVAWYPGLLLYTIYAMAEPLFMLLVVLALIAARRASLPGLMGAGLLAGLATLTRQAGAGVAAALFLWAAFRSRLEAITPVTKSRRALLAIALVVGVSVAMAPWVARNYVVFGRWVVLETTGGITFLMSNYEDATGRYLLSDWETVHQRYLNALPEEFTRSQVAYRLGLERIASDPIRILKLVPKRLGYLFDLEGREHVYLYTSTYFGPRSPSVVIGVGWALLLSFPLLVIAAIASVFFGPPPRAETELIVLWVLAVMLLQLLTVFGDARFHLPLVPLLAFLAVRPMHIALSRWRAAVGIALLVAALIWWVPRVPDRIRALEQAATPNGWQSAQPY